ncbi:DUF1365 domain-containing protein [Mangrovicoccus algicola]|uniref:DUF1365 domain-containing protein n=1 Tax=Mangrovicoccus algicola TaxID=2771008 RepID=A0A8J7CUI9_9RHOB|nr:DUF1365 domain-containing protein [Mangrovicoccus algicola]MBE3637559.1 DUF1365 domain-containing protein [Mangrovicoccus algicola]
MSDLWQGALIGGRVWHARSGDAARSFRYRAAYLALPLAAFEAGMLPLRPDRPGLWRIRRRDHGARDGTDLQGFIRARLAPLGLEAAEVALVTTPRTSGYGFNPVSFWLARQGGHLRAVLAEVSNTFGEHHFYLIRHPDLAPVTPSCRIRGEKLFHVSPFLPRTGHYVFRFDAGPGRFGAWIDWTGPSGEIRLGTSLTGQAAPLSAARLRRAAMAHPLQAQRIMALIHWQAARIYLRGLPFHSKPAQLPCRLSGAEDRS